MNKKKKSKAFTLTELLVVVVVIGVLSAVVLPKFSKVIETRRTTEAEELMASIRTEQERRCALDKNYLTDLSKMNDIVKNPNTKNYTLTLASTGINATRKENYSYTLEMPSYADGRICCRGDDCEKLNKNYPNCDDLMDKAKTPDYQASPENCAGAEIVDKPASKECTGTKPDDKQPCNDCGEQTREVTCNTVTGAWETGAWSTCSKTKLECNPIELPDPTIDNCRIIKQSNWSECCSGKYSDSRCYQVCTEKKTTTSGSGNVGGDPAADLYLCNNLKKGEWREDARCLGVNAEHLVSGICAGMTLCNGAAYVPVKPSSPGSTLTPVEGGSTGNTLLEVEGYMCAVGEECSKSCKGFRDGISAQLKTDNNLKADADNDLKADRDNLSFLNP